MAIDLEKGISLKIEGELGKFQTLPVDSLIKIAETLQELVLSIAKYDLPADEAIDINNFKIELSDFQKGSAIPSFILTRRIQPVVTGNTEQQRQAVTQKLSALFELSDKGDYAELGNLYPEPIKRNEIVEKLYGFTTSFNNSPVLIYEKDKVCEEGENYRPKKFKSSTKKSLMVDVTESKDEKQEEKAFARIKVTTQGGKSRNKIEEVISTSYHSLSYSPDTINVNQKQYILNYPLRCLFEKENDYYVINNELLDIIGTGETQDETETNFNEEFDYLYNRLNSLNDSQLTQRLVRIRNVLNDFVKEVI